MKICTLMSGSSGNAIYIETARCRVLIDAGQNGKSLAQKLQAGCGVSPELLDAILITHAHRDHVTAAGVMARRYRLPIYATEGTWGEMEPLIGKIQPWQQNVINAGEDWEIGDIAVETFPTSHDALDSVGYLCTAGKKSVGIATDCGVFTQRMANILRRAHCLVLEANHDLEMLKNGPYPWPLKKRIAGARGHLSNEDAGKALLSLEAEQPQHIILAHLSQENNLPPLALRTVQDILRQSPAPVGKKEIIVAPRYSPGPIIEI